MATPELDKMVAVRDQSQVIGEFLDWLKHERGCAFYDVELIPIHDSIEELLARFFGIDLDKVEAERREILAEIRKRGW